MGGLSLKKSHITFIFKSRPRASPLRSCFFFRRVIKIDFACLRIIVVFLPSRRLWHFIAVFFHFIFYLVKIPGKSVIQGFIGLDEMPQGDQDRGIFCLSMRHDQHPRILTDDVQGGRALPYRHRYPCPKHRRTSLRIGNRAELCLPKTYPSSCLRPRGH